MVDDLAWRHISRWLLVILGLTLIPAMYTVLTAGGELASHLTPAQIFVTACLEDRQERVLLCLERENGKTLWQQTVLRAPLEKRNNLNRFCTIQTRLCKKGQ